MSGTIPVDPSQPNLSSAQLGRNPIAYKNYPPGSIPLGPRGPLGPAMPRGSIPRPLYSMRPPYPTNLPTGVIPRVPFPVNQLSNIPVNFKPILPNNVRPPIPQQPQQNQQPSQPNQQQPQQSQSQGNI